MPHAKKLLEGTKYAAIRSRSTDKYFLFIDDVTFIPADAAPAAVTLKGYNIYRNGMKLNSTLLTEPAYTDGRTVASAEATPTVRISLQPGFYVVNAAGHIAKVIVG